MDVQLPPALKTRRARRIGIALAVLVGLRAALPYALEWGIGWGGERAAGVPVSVENVDLQILRGGVALEGLAVAGVGHPATAEGGVDVRTALLRWDRLAVNLEWLDLLRGRLRLSELSLAGAHARTELDEAGEPILPAPGGEAPAETPPEEVPETPPVEPPDQGGGLPILVDRLELADVGFVLLDGPEDSPAVRAGIEAFELDDVSFDETGLGLGAIGIRAPYFRVRRDYAMAEPSDAPPEAPAKRPAEPAAAEPAAGPAATYRMEHLLIERAEFTMLTDVGPVDMALRVDARGATTEPGVRFPIEVGLEIEQGAVDLSGELGAVPPTFTGDLRWRDLPLPPLTMFARPDLAAWIESHTASGELAIEFHLEPEAERPGGVWLRGTAASHDLLFRDPEQGHLSLAWKRFEIPIDEVFIPLGEAAEESPVRVALGRVRILEPRFALQQPTTALDRLLPPSEEAEEEEPAAEAPEAEPGPAPIVTLAALELEKGELVYQDRSLRPAYSGRIRALSLGLRDARLPEATAAGLSLKARLPVRSVLSVEGSHGVRRSNLAMRLERLSLPPFNPYATGAAGYRLDEGQVSLETNARRRSDAWEVDNELVLHQLALSSTGGGMLDELIGIPVGLALALLRDLEGNIALSIPVGFDRNGLRVGIGTVVRDALRAAVAGAVTSPLKMMGAAVSLAEGGGLSVEPLRMLPGESRLAPGQEESVEALAGLLEARPGLAARLTGDAAEGDREGLAERILVERLAAGGDLPDLEDTGFFARRRVRGALEKRGRGEEATLEGNDAALLARYVTATFVPPEHFVALAQARASAVAAILTDVLGVAPAHVRVAEETGSGQAAVRIGFEAR